MIPSVFAVLGLCLFAPPLAAAEAPAAPAAPAAPTAKAYALHTQLLDMLATHKRIKAAEADLDAARESAKEALGGWFPTLDLTTNYGYEHQKKGQGVVDTSVPYHEIDLSLSQTLWDFGSTNATIRRAGLAIEQSRAALMETRQGLVLEGVTAYLDLMRAFKVLNFSRGSETNIKRQTELETARVDRGSGFSTDVLQAKTQLAGAQALRVRNEGALRLATNRFLAVFGIIPADVAAMTAPRAPVEMLPKTVDATVQSALENNHNLRASAISAYIAREDLNKTVADKFFPAIKATASQKWKQDVGGTIGGKTEQLIQVELTYGFNLGATAINTLRVSRKTLAGTELRVGDSKTTIEEQVRNEWENYQTATANAGLLRNQADIASEFLELARKERQLGRRTLIDVLAGETALINASSDAASAETDVALAMFRLLAIMGKLDLAIIERK